MDDNTYAWSINGHLPILVECASYSQLKWNCHIDYSGLLFEFQHIKCMVTDLVKNVKASMLLHSWWPSLYTKVSLG